MSGWTVHYPGCRAWFRLLRDAHLESLRRRVPVMRGGRAVTVSQVADGNGGLLLTARWER